MTQLTLNSDQNHALGNLNTWWYRVHNKDSVMGPVDSVFRLQGLAGTGKTTIIQEFTRKIDGTVLYGAYTAKAASVMRAKGMPTATTIHSMIYRPSMDVLAEKIRENDLALACAKTPEETKKLQEVRQRIYKAYPPDMSFTKVPELPPDVKLIVLDECSMIDKGMCDDLRSYGIPILVIGDPGQLPPIKGFAGFFQEEPDYTLTHIVRQASDSPIIALAMEARTIGRLKEGVYGNCTVHDVNKLSETKRDAFLLGADKIIVRTNKSRITRNSRTREMLGLPIDKPVEGDIIMCWENHRPRGLWNGCEYTVHEIVELPNGSFDMKISLLNDPNGRVIEVERVHPYRFRGYSIETVGSGDNKHQKLSNPRIGTSNLTLQEQNSIFDAFSRRGAFQFDFCHAITCHKAQGSQWDNVYVIPEFKGDTAWGDDKLWLYTAITRAAKEVHVRL